MFFESIRNLFIFYIFYGLGVVSQDENDPPGFLQDRDVSLTFTNLHKCSCLANEIWFNGVCQENSTTIQVLIDLHPSRTEIIGTNVIQNIEVSDVTCPPNYLNLTLPGESFALKESGELFNLNYDISLEFSKYCVEYFYDSNNNEINSEVHLCLAISNVPLCCPDEAYDGFNNECSLNISSDVSVPFLLGKNMFETETDSFINILKCQTSSDRTRVLISQNTRQAFLKLTNNGLELVHKVSQVGDMVYVPPTEYCLQVEDERVVSASYCYEDLFTKHQQECTNETCIRKCCPVYQVYDMDTYRCVTVGNKKQDITDLYERFNYTDQSTSEAKLVIGFPIDCEFFSISPLSSPLDIFQLLPNGYLLVENMHLTLPPYQYCINNFKYEQTIVEGAFICFAQAEEIQGCDRTQNILYPILLLISCIFLAITLIVYALIPDLHAKVQSKCLIANISSLLASYICLLVIRLGFQSLSHRTCVAFGLLTQFSTLSSFFWLNVMCYDIWRTLRSMNTGRESPTSARRRYLKYSLYAWGCPLIIFIVTIVMQNISSHESNLILPRLGQSSCFFPVEDSHAMWAYMFGFISVLLVINLGFFIHLAFILLKAQNVSKVALGKVNQLHKEWAKLYLKLFLIMGITWIFEVTSMIEGSCGIWIATDIVNSLRGLLIFIIFVCKRDIIKKLMTESSPAFQRMTTTMRQSSMFSRSSKTTSNFYVDPSSTTATNNEDKKTDNQDDVTL